MIRCKTFETGNYMEKELFNLSPFKKPLDRARKEKESTPAQKNLNDKKSKKHLRRVLHKNFGKGDMFLSLTFDDEHLPESEEDAHRLISNFIRAARRMWLKRFPLKPFRYVYIYSEVNGETGEVVRPHFHMIMSGAGDAQFREDVEKKWSNKNGYCNAHRLKFGKDGLQKLVTYMLKQATGKRRWKGSNNLLKPEAVISDKAVSRAEMEKIRRNPDDIELLEKIINRGRKGKWHLAKCEITYDGRELFGSDIDPGRGMGIAILIRAYKEDWTK